MGYNEEGAETASERQLYRLDNLRTRYFSPISLRLHSHEPRIAQ
jgi:hypothetical protein